MATFFELMPRPLITNDQLRLLKYDNVLSNKYSNNDSIGVPSKRFFSEEVKKYSYMWKEGGEYSKEKFSLKKN
jgi:NADH dehydrogenase